MLLVGSIKFDAAKVRFFPQKTAEQGICSCCAGARRVVFPGIGQATVAAGLRSDVPLLLGIVLISATFVFVGNLLADVIYEYVDPRIRSENDE